MYFGTVSHGIKPAASEVRCHLNKEDDLLNCSSD